MCLRRRLLAALLLPAWSFGCEGEETEEPQPVFVEGTTAEIGPAGGELVAPLDGSFAGFVIKIPPGALEETVTIAFAGAFDETPLPETAERVGPQITIEPAGTVLAKPAELTLPLDPEMLANYEGTPETCKVWARDEDAWERIDAIRHGLGSVTIPLSTLTTAAAGVNFAVTKTCNNCPTIAPVADEPACASVSQEYCVVKLPRPSPMSFLDEFASLRVVGRKVYWAGRLDGDPTVYRYDLDDPGPSFVYPAYTGEAVGANATRGRVAVKSETEVWASFSAYGNLRFRTGSDAQAYDRPPTRQPAGVMATSTEVTRFARQSTAGSNNVDVRLFNGTSDTNKFLFNYAKVIPGSEPLEANPPESLVAQGNPLNFFFRSIHRGKGHGFDPGPQTAGFGFWGANFEAPGSSLGTVLDNDTVTFGAAGFVGPINSQLSAQVSGSGTKIRTNNGVWHGSVVMTPPAPIRDLTYRSTANGATDIIAIASGREQIYVFTAGGGLTTLALPADEVGMVPWRVERIEGGEEEAVLIVTRGPLTEKGQFYLLKKK